MDNTEMHLGRIREVKEMGSLDDTRDIIKEEVVLESPGHQVRNKKPKIAFAVKTGA